MGTVLLVRHGETQWTVEDRIQGWAPVDLTDAGVAQVSATAGMVDDEHAVDRVVTSDLRRTRQTAAVLRECLSARESDRVPVVTDRRWRERDFGALQGLPAERYLDRPDYDLVENGTAGLHARPKGGETWADLRTRVGAAFDALDVASGETVAVVTHCNPIRLVLGRVRGVEPIPALVDQRVPTASVTVLERRAGTGTPDTAWRVADGPTVADAP